MRKDSVEWVDGKPKVKVRPSAERGVFFNGFGSDRTVGRLAVFTGMPDELARTIEDGDPNGLWELAEDQLPRLGEYQLKPGINASVVDHSGAEGAVDILLYEFEPPRMGEV